MSLFKFGKGDVIKNTLLINPRNKFFIHNGNVVYNDTAPIKQTEDNTKYTTFVPSGHISLKELNIDRVPGNNDVNLIRPYRIRENGDKEDGYYPLSASISQDRYETTYDYSKPSHMLSLKNTINFYKYLDPILFDFENLTSNYNLTLISIPSIFYGKSINKGSVQLNFYESNVLTGTIKDFRTSNSTTAPTVGKLYSDSDKSSPKGVILYDEGFIILFSKPNIESDRITSTPSNSVYPTWDHWGIETTTHTTWAWDLEFEGVSETPVVTMMAHAGKDEINYSNNLTFLKNLGTRTKTDDGYVLESSDRDIKNVSKELDDGDTNFNKETYISKIAIYDKDKNIIAYAKLARPIRKTEERELTFKLKLDL